MYPSYIKSAFTLAFSMTALLLLNVFSNYNKWVYVIPILGLVVSGLLSKTGFAVGLLVGAATCIVYVWLKNVCNRKDILVSIVVLVSVLLVVSAAWIANDKLFYGPGDLEWNTALEYDSSLEKLKVFGYPDYNGEELGEYGILESDYDNIVEEQYYVISTDGLGFLKKLAKMRHEYSMRNVLRFCRTVPVRWIKVGFLYLWVFAAFLYAQIKNENKHLIYVAAIVYVFLIYFFAYIHYGWDNKMVQLIAFIPVIYLFILNTSDVRSVDNREAVVILILAAVVLYNNFSSYIVTNVLTTEMDEYFEDNIETGKVYAINIDALLEQYSAYKPYDFSLSPYAGKILTLNGSYSIYPMYQEYMLYTHPVESVWYFDGSKNDVSWIYISK